MDESWIGAYDFGFAMSAVAQLGCLVIIARQIVLRLSWRARVRWTALLAFVYVGTLVASSRLAVAAILTTLIMQTLMTVRDGYRVLRVAAVAQQPYFPHIYQVLIKPLGEWIGEPGFKWITVVLVTVLAVFVIWEPRDGVFTPQIMEFISAPTRYVSAWWLAADVFMIALAAFLVETENTIRDFCYAASFAAGVFCALLLLSSRPCFSALTVFLITFGLAHLSTLKFRRTTTNLHAYDLLYIFRNYSTVAFWLKTELSDAVPLLLKVFSSAILVSIVGFSEPAAIDRRLVALLFALALGVVATARGLLVPRPYWFSLRERMSFAVFIETIVEAFHAHRSRGVLRTEAVLHSPEFVKMNFSNLTFPKLEGCQPTIILIMNESTFPPSLYFPEGSDRVFADFFESADARNYGLRVEVFGGPTWMTEFSVLTGIPSLCYGSFGTHVFHWATNRIHHSLPQYLRRYGYRTGLICPTFKEFVGGDRFYTSIGFDEIRDRRTFGTRSECESDAFYLNRGLDWLSDHFAGEGGSAFLYVLTMSNHYPHAAPDSEFDEYMRRLRRTCRDYFDFRAELAKRFPDRQFLIVHFGDHQPPFTAHLQGRHASHGAAHEDWFPGEEVAYRTYFALHGVNFQPLIEPNLPELIEPAYLSTLTLAAAGVPLDGLHAFRYKLMKRHDGRLFFADKDGKIAAQLNHHMMECGLISKH